MQGIYLYSPFRPNAAPAICKFVRAVYRERCLVVPKGCLMVFGRFMSDGAHRGV